MRNPQLTLPILEKLRFDSELFVRKSIANHLNDITKDHPEFVIKVLTRWKKEASLEDSHKINWIVNRSLRTLIKDGHPGALKLIGVSKAQIKLDNFQIKQKKIKLGDRLDFQIDIRSTSNKDQKLVVDYIIHFIKANKNATSKVFKLKTTKILAKNILIIKKSHHFKKITTRNYYSGIHGLEIQVNGNSIDKKNWVLEL